MAMFNFLSFDIYFKYPSWPSLAFKAIKDIITKFIWDAHRINRIKMTKKSLPTSWTGPLFYKLYQIWTLCMGCIEIWNTLYRDLPVKGQLISKWFFGVIDFLQKTNERIRLYYYDTSGRLVFVRFLEEIDDPKNHFEINWPL